MQSRHGLGRGLDALLPETEEQTDVAIAEIGWPAEQPRRVFAQQALMELAHSIKLHGILQPLVVTTATPEKEGAPKYELIAGERRLRAAKLAGLRSVPVRVRETLPPARYELALVENLQRADLSPLEEARAYQKLLESGKLTQESLAQRLGKSRPKIANSLRLLNLPAQIATALEDGRITAGHAQAILAQPTEAARAGLFKAIVADGLSVREAERWKGAPETASRRASQPASPAWVRELETSLGTKVEQRGSDRRGKLLLHYGSSEELNALLERLGVTQDG